MFGMNSKAGKRMERLFTFALPFGPNSDATAILWFRSMNQTIGCHMKMIPCTKLYFAHMQFLKLLVHILTRQLKYVPCRAAKGDKTGKTRALP